MSQRGEKNWDNKTEREREEKRKVPQNTKSGKTKKKKKKTLSFTINFTSEHNLKKKIEAKRRKRLKLHRNPLNVVEKLYRPNNYDHRAPKPCFILGTHKGSRKRVKFTGFTCGGGGWLMHTVLLCPAKLAGKRGIQAKNGVETKKTRE